MIDRPQNERDKYLENFAEKFETGLAELLESLEQFGPVLLPPDPSSLDMDDERTLEELDKDEIEMVKKSLYKVLGVRSDNLESRVKEYQSETHPKAAVPGMIEVVVFKTNIENIFLHEMVFKDSNIRWVIGPNQEI